MPFSRNGRRRIPAARTAGASARPLWGAAIRPSTWTFTSGERTAVHLKRPLWSPWLLRRGDHSGLFKWTAVRSPDVNVQVDGRIAAPQRGRADAPAVRAAGIRRRPLRENGMREKERSKKKIRG